jgi:hypothetical protein
VFSWAIQKLNRHSTSLTIDSSGRYSAMMDVDLKLHFRDDVPHLLPLFSAYIGKQFGGIYSLKFIT